MSPTWGSGGSGLGRGRGCITTSMRSGRRRSAVALGLFYRFSVGALGVLWTYVWLIEQGKYNNHYYFVSLLALLMFFIPAHRGFSVDAWLRPGLRSSTGPAWVLWLLRFQVGVPYFFGGVAKIYPEWLSSDIARLMLLNRFGDPLVGAWCDAEWAVQLMTWGIWVQAAKAGLSGLT